MPEKPAEASDTPEIIPGSYVLTRYMRKKIEGLLIHLNEKEKTVIIQLFGLNSLVMRSPERISREMGITIQSLKQIQESALSKIFTLLDAEKGIPHEIHDQSGEEYVLNILREKCIAQKEEIQSFLDQQTAYTNEIIDYFRKIILPEFSVTGNSRLTKSRISLYILMRKIIAYRYRPMYALKSKALSKAHMIEILTDMGFSLSLQGNKKK